MKELPSFSLVETVWTSGLNEYYSWRHLGKDPSEQNSITNRLVAAFSARRAWNERYGYNSLEVSPTFVDKLKQDGINPELLGIK